MNTPRDVNDDIEEGGDEEIDEEGDELAEGEEICPICGALVDPGAMTTCVHYIGCEWDGDIIWSNSFDEYRTSWGKVSDLIDSAEEAGIERSDLLARATAADLDQAMLRVADSSEWSPARAALELVRFSNGEYRETDGMLSGGGSSLFHKNPMVLIDLAKRYEDLAIRLRAILSTDLLDPPSS